VKSLGPLGNPRTHAATSTKKTVELRNPSARLLVGSSRTNPINPRRHCRAGDARRWLVFLRVAVTASRKLFVAAVLLAAGFGVARLLGKPAARLYVPSSGVESAAPQLAAANKHARASLSPASQPAGARLVPDIAGDNPLQTNTVSGEVATAPLIADGGRGGRLQDQRTASQHDAFPYAVYTPSARLRNEAPRPLDFSERQPPANAVSAPPWDPRTDTAAATVSDQSTAPRASLPDAYQSDLQTIESDFEASNAPSNSPATITASYTPPVGPMLSEVLITAPPWPAPSLREDDRNGPRKHIVIDGDSLEKLAGRYLDDPQRAGEIYDANRELLASPDLLPIGAELHIPDRRNQTADALPRQSLASDFSVRAAQNMVPVRPIPPAAAVMPRAQLLPPRSAD
jgi:hypothetical protein